MKIEGIIPALVTPMHEDESINYEATERLIDKLVDQGVDGLFILGTNGEFYVLSNEEKLKFAKKVIDYTNKRVPVYVGSGANSTQETIELSLKFKEIGADALSIVTPYFVTPTQEELVEHYKTIANAVDLPIILYNMTPKSGINIDPETLKQLIEVENIVAVKDSSGKLENLMAYLEVTKSTDFSVLTGSDSLILKALKAGAVGAVAGTANVIAPVDILIYKHFKEGNLEKAQRAQDAIEMLRTVNKFSTIPSVMKTMVSMQGIDVGPARLPASRASKEQLIEIESVVKLYETIFKDGSLE